jgi:hypothetical protein
MRRTVAIFAALLLWAGLTACEEKASDGEIAEMCKHLNKIGGEFDFTPAEIRLAKVETDFGNQVKHLENQRDDAVKVIDADRASKLLELKTDEEKAKLQADSDAAKAAKTAEFQALIDKVGVDKAAALKDTEQKMKDDEAAAKQAAEKCVAENKGTGIGKKIAQCRILTATTDEYWKCR